MIYSKISITLLLLILSIIIKAQVGGNVTPMQYSTHTYSVDMEEESNNPVWKIYSGHISANDIESGGFEANLVTRNVQYTVNSDDIIEGEAIIEILFNGNMVPGLYTISYLETNDDLCFKTIVLHITMQGPFDIDVNLDNPADAANCPDLSDLFKDPLATNYQTTIPYSISMVNPDTDDGFYSGSTWTFNYAVQITGRSAGLNSTIASVLIEYDGYSQLITLPGTSSAYNNSLTVNNSSTVTEVLISVTFNDQLGVTQDVRFELSEIEGAYLESDVDGFDRVDHVIFGMPDVGVITALN
jgi:hypothetical protein